jgi:hypothetical protein
MGYLGCVVGRCDVADLSPKQLRILKVLHSERGWVTRVQMEEQAGRKGFSKALGAPTGGGVRPGSLEQLGYVVRRDLTRPFVYRITELGERALAKNERDYGEVQLRSTPPDDDAGFQAGISGRLPEEVAETPALLEGAVTRVSVNAYERRPEARRRCIAAHGTDCCICGFSFGEVYGEVAEGYIHVHHLRSLSEIGGEYEVNPVEDLRPVCPNCHAVLHLGGECLSIQEVRRMVEDNRA